MRAFPPLSLHLIPATAKTKPSHLGFQFYDTWTATILSDVTFRGYKFVDLHLVSENAAAVRSDRSILSLSLPVIYTLRNT